MKKMKMKMAMAMGAVVFVLSACGQTENPEDTQTNAVDGAAKISDSTDGVWETQNDEAADSAGSNPAESKDEGHSVIGKEDVLESLIGEYGYLSDYGTGRLTIKKTSYGYDISDYESESSYRFLADSSNIETVEDDGIYIKYPEWAFSDGEAVFGYYILKYGTDGIDVYYGKSAFEEAEFLYHATKITKTAAGVDEDIATVTILGREWLDFAGLSEYRFYKTSDVLANQQENSAQAVEKADSESTSEELLDLFINGSINAVDPADSTSTFYITDLNRDSEEWDSFSIGEKVDLDNDGENELIICGPYGGIYLDARDNKVYEFAVGEGTALVLSYTYYNGAVWIMYSNRSSAGFEFYHMEKFEGADNFAAEMNFGEELADPDNAEAGMKYTLNGAEISYDEYTELCSKIFAAQVNTF